MPRLRTANEFTERGTQRPGSGKQQNSHLATDAIRSAYRICRLGLKITVSWVHMTESPCEAPVRRVNYNQNLAPAGFHDTIAELCRLPVSSDV